MTTLEHLHTLATNYVAQNVVIRIRDLEVVGIPPSISPGDDFTFSVTAENPAAADGGMPLANVIWHVWVDIHTTSGTTIYVPDSPLDAYLDEDLSGSQLSVGSRYRDFYIAPQGQRGYLDAGETNRIDLRGQATTQLQGGTFDLKFEILGTPDLGLPQSRSRAPFVEPLVVVDA